MKDEIKAFTVKVAALEASLQFTQQEQDDIKDRVATCEKDEIRQETELTRLSIYSRSGNLLLFKISETKGENYRHIVKDVLKNNFQIPDQRAEFIGLVENTTNSKTDYRPFRLPGRHAGTMFGASAVFLQSLTSEWGKTYLSTCVKYGKVLVPVLKKAQRSDGVKPSIVRESL